jgi:hypothetical protein
MPEMCPLKSMLSPDWMRRDGSRKMRADGLQSAKPLPLVDAAFEGERGYRPDRPR